MLNSKMDQFCGSVFWDENLMWYSDHPDLSPCFQKTVLIWVPCIFLWTFSFLEAYYLINSKTKNIPYTWKFITKAIITIFLILLSVIDLIMAVSASYSKTVFAVAYYTPLIKIATFTLASLLLYYNKKFGMRSSGLLCLFWFFLTICGLVQFRSLLNNYNSQTGPSYSFVSYMIYYPLVVIMFLLHFLADAKPTFSEYPESEFPSPEQSSSYFSKIFFSWFDGLAWQGFRKPLQTSDLWSLNPEDTAAEIVPKFEKYWKRNIEKLKNTENAKASFRKSSGEIDFNNSKKKKVASVIFPLYKAFGSIFLVSGILKFVEDIMVFISPLILGLLIDFVKGSESLWKGYLYAALLLATSIFQSLVISQYFYRMNIIGMRMRTAIVAAIYRKSLKMSNTARKESTVGEIVNLMSVDAQHFTELMPYIHILWSAPLQIILAVYFLWKQLGPSVLAGLGVMIILIPVNGVIANRERILQIKQMKNKDDRIKLMNEILNGIKVLKLYAWELSFQQQVYKIRNKEVKRLRELAYINAATNFIWSCAPFLVSFVSFATYVLIDDKNILDSNIAFVSMSLFNILRLPLALLPIIIAYLIQALVSVKRINAFMNTEDLDPNNVEHNQSDPHPLIIENGTFLWDSEDSDKPTLNNINIQVHESQLAAIVGTVGSGKSSIISAFLGEMKKITGRVNTKGSIAYVAQQAWIQNATVQDNILFGKAMNKSLYARVIEACALKFDIEMLPAGDQTEIGEKGINLSGGQKQRVALARAVYSDCDIYLLDDPLSAVDAHVGKHIFENVIGPTGLLKKKTRVLVTHSITYLSETDNIIVLNDGEITETGTYNYLLEKRGVFADFLSQHLHVKSDDDTDIELAASETLADEQFTNDPFRRQQSVNSNKSDNLSHNSLKEKTSTLIAGEKIIEEERAETGSVKLKAYIHYLQSIGWFLSISTVLMNAMFQVFNISTNIWVSKWSDDNEAFINGTTDVSQKTMYVGVYGALGVGQAVFVLIAHIMLAISCLRSSIQLHSDLLFSILRSPMSFFDTTPLGRVLNRFGKDIDVIDNLLPETIRGWLHFLMEAIATFIIMSYGTPMFLVVIVPIAIVYVLIQRFYVATSRQLKRLESMSRSPIYSHFGESISGAQTIRAFGVQDRFILESERRVDFNQMCYFPETISDRWLAIRLEMIGNLIIFFAALFSVLGRATLSPGSVGLSISYGLQITQILNWLVRITSDVETNIIAVERIKEYTESSPEAPWDVANTTPPKDWPHEGHIEFRNFKVCYREGLDLVLNGLNFVVHGGEKVGIVGRTGAGKSSLTLTLFRIIEATEGKIFIDNIDVSKLGLHVLRERLTIIPQEPVLFSGTLRLNLDPFDTHTDDEIWRTLEHAHLKTFVKSLTNGLSYAVLEGGENLSVGQRQLICLARALLKKTKILILDEATAAVDLETDDLIQRTIREEFKNCTVLTIAHRLKTILDSDKVLVLDKGKAKEFESPEVLLKNPTSAFYSMARDAGIVS